MSREIVLVVPLVLVVALVMSVSTSAPGKVALTDAQMSSVYGGAKCRYYDNDGCDPVYCYGDCSEHLYWPCGDAPNLPNCNGSWTTTCKQEQRLCKGGGPGCTNQAVDCLGTYDAWSCLTVYDECEVNWDGTFDCDGGKLWCYQN
jgi:hypothetical protein